MRLRTILALSGTAGALTFAALGFGVQGASALQPNPLGLGLQPVLGYSSWSAQRQNPSLAQDEAEANAMVSTGLKAVGYQYINQDDFWYICPNSSGPVVDQWGRWVTDPTKFPSSGSINGIQVLASYVHSLGLKFGIYLTPGISNEALGATNTPIEQPGPNGTQTGQPSGYTADQIAAPNNAQPAMNYNCGGMEPFKWDNAADDAGAQDFYDSLADEYASWGVDFIKFDGMENYDGPDLQALQNAIAQSSNPHMLLDATEGDYTIAFAPQLDLYSTQNEFSPDVETSGGSLDYTRYQNLGIRFNTLAAWEPWGGPGNEDDFDSVEIGNGSAPGFGGREDGLTVPGRMTQLSLWSLGASPLILGADMTTPDPTDYAMLENKAVLAVDQDAVPAGRIGGGIFSNNATQYQVASKLEPTGTAGDIGLFNTDDLFYHVISSNTAQMGLPASPAYLVNDLWTGQTTETGPALNASAAPQGVALWKITPISNASQAPPNTTINETGLGTLTPGQPATGTVTLTNNGVQPAQGVSLSLSAPSGFTVSSTSPTTFSSVGQGQTVSSTFSVTAPPLPTPAGATNADGATNFPVTANAGYSWPGNTAQTNSVTQPVTVAQPVRVNEVQLGITGDSTYQFVELYNAGSTNVNIGGWGLVYRAGSAAMATANTLSATIPANTTLSAGGYYLFGRPSTGASNGYSGTPAANQTFTTSLSTSAGSVGIDDANGDLVDSVGWGTSNDSLVQDCPAPAPATVAAPGQSIVRIPNGTEKDSNCNDWAVSTHPTPAGPNVLSTALASSSASLSPAQGNGSGWYNVDPTVTLSSTVTAPCMSSTILYSVDAGATNTYAAPFQITGDGTHTLQYHAVDCGGTSEPTHTLTVNIATAAPVTTATVTPAPVNGQVNGPAAVTLSVVEDAALQPSLGTLGAPQTFYSLDGGAWRQYTGQYNGPFTITAGGLHTIQYYSIDPAGNIEGTHTLTVQVNPQATTNPGGSVPSTLSLSIASTSPSFGAFAPGVPMSYTTSTTASATSTAASAALTAVDTSSVFTGHLVNTTASGGPYELASPLQVDATDGGNGSSTGYQALSSSASSPVTLLNYAAPVSSDPVTIGFLQPIGATDPLRTGTYSKTITFTLSTTTP